MKITVLVYMHECTIENSLAVVICLYLCFSKHGVHAHTEIIFNLSMISENTFREAALANQEKNTQL